MLLVEKFLAREIYGSGDILYVLSFEACFLNNPMTFFFSICSATVGS